MSTIQKNAFYALTAPRQIEKISTPLLDLPDEWVRLRFYYCGICGSDVSHFDDRRDPAFPMPLGHEFIARVEALGAGVDHLRIGDLVTSDLQYRCGECEFCTNAQSHLCRKGRKGFFSNRAFAVRGDLHQSYLYKVPGNEPFPKMALAEPLSCVLHCIEGIDFDSAKRVLLLGAGSIGICMAFAMNIRNVKFDVVDTNPARLQKIRKCIDFEAPSGLYDLVFDSTGTPSGLLASCKYLRPGGTLISMSHVDGMKQEEQFLILFSRKDATLKMPYLNGDSSNMNEAISALSNYWTGNWNDLLAVQPAAKLQALFENPNILDSNKLIVDCTGIQPD
ncbi:MAG: alcohol dehydrogenase catalytic domain-containing protein [Chitinophagales bacterium]|nr:alcohol dehydrogenase catalytic domain-containing protein [Chitinophagales bacterium]